jgi:hypothetical protein
MGTITVNGHAFRIPTRYQEGHECTAPEAAALQKKYEINLKPSVSKIVEEGLSNDLKLEAIEDAISARAARYQFGMRVGGGAPKKPKDPIEVQAMLIAKLHAREQARRAGFKGKDLMKQTSVRARELAKRPDYLKLAKQMLTLQD